MMKTDIMDYVLAPECIQDDDCEVVDGGRRIGAEMALCSCGGKIRYQDIKGQPNDQISDLFVSVSDMFGATNTSASFLLKSLKVFDDDGYQMGGVVAANLKTGKCIRVKEYSGFSMFDKESDQFVFETVDANRFTIHPQS